MTIDNHASKCKGTALLAYNNPETRFYSNEEAPAAVTTLPPWQFATEFKEENKYTWWGMSTGTKCGEYDAAMPPPSIGTRVKIIINGWDGIKGTVTGYYETHGCLMIRVLPDKQPKWHAKEYPASKPCYFAGMELIALARAKTADVTIEANQ